MLKIILPLISLPMLLWINRCWITTSTTIIFIIIPILFLAPTFFMTSTSNIFFIDLLNSSIILLSLWIAALILISRQKLYINKTNEKKFLFIIVLLTLILIIAFRSNNFLRFYIFFESSLIPTFIIILGWGVQPERIQARTYLMLYTVTSSLPLLICLIIISKWNKSLFIFFRINTPIVNSYTLTPLWIFLLIAFIVKIPIYTTHLWLPKAHVEAPVAGSIVLAAILLKLGRYGIIRILAVTLFNNLITKPIFISISILGAIITSLICLRQTDLKALIAYSSVGHIGILITSSLTATQWAWQGALITIIAHGLTSSGIFAICNIIYENTQTRRLTLTKGLLAIFPLFTTMWFMLCLCNIARPPRINLIGEIILIAPPLFITLHFALPLVILRFIRGAYSVHLYTTTNHGNPPLFLNPSSLFSARNFSIIILHIFPSLTLIFKIDLISLQI